MTLDAAIREAVAEAVAPLAREIAALRDKVSPPREWVTIQEAAEMNGVTTATIRNWIKAGQLEAKGRGKARRVKV